MKQFQFGKVTNKSLGKVFKVFLNKLVTPSRIKSVASASKDFTDPDLQYLLQGRSAEIDEFICSLFLIPDFEKMKIFARDKAHKQLADGFIVRTSIAINLLLASEVTTDLKDVHPLNYMPAFIIFRQVHRQKALAFSSHQVS